MTTVVGVLAGTVVVIFGSGEGSTVVGRLEIPVVVVRSIEGATVLVVVVVTVTGSTGVEVLPGIIVE